VSTLGFDPTAPGMIPLLVLWGVRLSGLLLIAPVYSERTIPMMVRAALLLLRLVVLLPAALAHADEPVRVTPVTITSELLIGFAIGLGAAIFIAAAEVAGDILAFQTGLSSANVMDPLTQQSVPVLGQFMQLFALTLLVTADGHLIMLEALAASVAVIPVGGAIDVAPGLSAMVLLGGTLFSLGLRFAAPVIAVVLVSNIALGILGRVAPQLNILMVAFPVQIGVGIFTLAFAVPLIATYFTSWPAAYESVLSGLLSAFGR
jgi:flagellar biosynthetic protein FliR